MGVVVAVFIKYQIPPGCKDIRNNLLTQDRELIPAALNIETRLLAGADASNAVRIADEEVPGLLAGIQDGVIVVPDEPTELVSPQILLDVNARDFPRMV